MEIEDSYKLMAKHSGINIGDTVRVLRKARNYELGWNNYWNTFTNEMNETIGKEYQVRVILEDGGIVLENGYEYPFFVLEIVREMTQIPKSILEKIEGRFGCYESQVKDLVVSILENSDKK